VEEFSAAARSHRSCEHMFHVGTSHQVYKSPFYGGKGATIPARQHPYQEELSLLNRLAHWFRRITSTRGQPWITLRVEARVIRIEVNKATLDKEVPYFEDVAPPACV